MLNKIWVSTKKDVLVCDDGALVVSFCFLWFGLVWFGLVLFFFSAFLCRMKGGNNNNEGELGLVFGPTTRCKIIETKFILTSKSHPGWTPALETHSPASLDLVPHARTRMRQCTFPLFYLAKISFLAIDPLS
jgi:hypothetical protein